MVRRSGKTARARMRNAPMVMQSYYYKGWTFVLMPNGTVLIHAGKFQPGDEHGPILYEAPNIALACSWVDGQ